MLQYLKIRNLALLEAAAIEFESGFTVVTGETGAGKSVFLGALSLLSGARTDKSVIRVGTDLCEVEASLWFDDCNEIDEALESMGLPTCEDGTLLLKRSLHNAKPSRISINGSLATLTNLQDLGGFWIDFHGPGEPQRLLKSDCQLELIDLYGKLENDTNAYRKTYREWQDVLGQIQCLQNESQLSDDQIEFLQMQIQSIDALELSEGSIERLEQDFNRVSGSQELLGLTQEIEQGISGDSGALNLLAQIAQSARQASELDPSLAELEERLSSAIVEMQELAGEYQNVGSSLNFEPEFAQEVEQKMSSWQELRRKHGRSVEAVLAARDEMAGKIENQGDIEGSLNRLNDQADSLERLLKTQAAKLTEKRLKAGRALAKEVESSLLELGFKKGKFDIVINTGTELKSYGNGLPEMQFSPNVGEPLKPLTRVASSGELARVMLALKTILAEVDHVPVLVFDEVDANVGGEVGRIVGEKMQRIGKNHQVICITHLPQVASLGANHFVARKDQEGSRAVVSIEKLPTDGNERVGELARMLGDRSAESALSHARELLTA